MINGSNLSNGLVNMNINMTSFKKHIWPFINTRHRKRLFTTARCPKGICISPLKQSHISFTTLKTKFKRFHLTTKKTFFIWLLKTTLKNKKHFTRYARLLIKKWNLGLGTIEPLQNYIVTPICQSARLQRPQILVL